MSKIAYTWSSDTPPRPDVYTTRRGESRYQTLRYWDGGRWWQIEWGAGARTSMEFKWPKGSRTRFPSGMAAYRNTLGLRRINYQAGIQWGDPYKVLDRNEVLAYPVKRGVLPPDWETCHQHEMNDALILMQFRGELTTILKTPPSGPERLAACRRLVDVTVARMPHLHLSTALSLLKDVAVEVHTDLGGKP